MWLRIHDNGVDDDCVWLISLCSDGVAIVIDGLFLVRQAVGTYRVDKLSVALHIDSVGQGNRTVIGCFKGRRDVGSHELEGNVRTAKLWQKCS